MGDSVAQKQREVWLTNTQTGDRERFEPLVPGKVSLYSCGPTVYGFIHIGNLRTALFADLMTRIFARFGYEVTDVRNYTDVDDRIIDRAHKESVSASEIAERFIEEVDKDYWVAGLKNPVHRPRATETMRDIIRMVERLIERGHAYVRDDGEVLFAVDSFDRYGALSKRKLEDQQAGARVEVDRKKRNPFDFALWKPAKPGEPAWESPWGPGRPGWHIECSAMIEKVLGHQIDIHHGGVDLIFPHHENEIAQSECSSGTHPFVKYWVHNEHLNIRSQKMSKSLGNIVTAREFLTEYGSELTRIVLLSAHYRSKIDFSEELLEQSIQSLRRIYEAKLKAEELQGKSYGMSDLRAETAWGEFVQEIEAARKEFDESLANDFNTPGALGAVFTLIRAFNRTLAEPKAESTPAAAQAAQLLIQFIEEDLGSILGVGRQGSKKALEELENLQARRLQHQGVEQLSREDIEARILERNQARAARDFKRADEIRDELLLKGVVLKDSPEGTTWTHKR